MSEDSMGVFFAKQMLIKGDGVELAHNHIALYE